MVDVREARPDDAGDWLRMRQTLWPEGSANEHGEEIARYFAGGFPRDPWVVLLARDAAGAAVGFAELSVRPYAEGCATSDVAYLEGWYVEAGERGQGVGRALVLAGEEWGRDRGCTEFASDADPDNESSIKAHLALGFADAGLIRCFHKRL